MDSHQIDIYKEESTVEKPKIKILLVDDREDNLFSIKTVLERDDYEFCTANSGKQALKILLKEYDFTLILMDVEMPEMNGFETASVIYERDKLKHIPIIFITANNYSDEYVFKGYSSGAVDYIYKPINPQLLRAKVAVFVELYKKNHLLMAQEQRLQLINSELEKRVLERTEEISRKNELLESSNSELIKVNNDLDSFVYMASHDLKAPVSNIEGLLHALRSTLPEEVLKDEEASMIFDMIDKSIYRFKNTIIDLSEISKIQKNLQQDIELITLSELLDEVSFSIRDTIDKPGALIKTDFSACTALLYSRKNLSSIMLNLLTNAIKYCHPDRKPLIYIKTKIQRGGVALIFEDNGIGMNPKDIHNIFMMFKRIHTHVEGSGVGLYLVKRILDNSGDSIDVKSEINTGSTFIINFKADKLPHDHK